MIPKILLVDDRPENLLALEGTLAVLDVECHRATSGPQALNLALDHEYALILLDVQMPGMSGFETAELLHGASNTRHVPVIFVTAISMDERHVYRGYETGAVDYLFKPIDPDILLSKVKVFVQLHRQKAQLAEQQLKLQAAVDELETSQAELKRSNEELERFAYVAAHDLQAPLRAMQSFATLLEAHLGEGLDDKTRHYINRITAGGQRMAELIRDLLVYSRVGQRGETAVEVELERVVKDALETLQSEITAQSAAVDVAALPTVMGHRAELQRLFENLIGNAVKYRGDAEPRVVIRCEERATELELSVEDNGIGIESEYSEQIFEIFQRLHGGGRYPGTGVGLAICRKVVEHHQGRIWLESAATQGSVFRFTLSR